MYATCIIFVYIICCFQYSDGKILNVTLWIYIHTWHILVCACCQLWLLTFEFISSVWHKTHMSTEYIATCCTSGNVERLFTLPYYHFYYISYYRVWRIRYFHVSECVCQFSSWYTEVRLLPGQVLQKVTPEMIRSVSFSSFSSAAILLRSFQIVDAICKYNRHITSIGSDI